MLEGLVQRLGLGGLAGAGRQALGRQGTGLGESVWASLEDAIDNLLDY